MNPVFLKLAILEDQPPTEAHQKEHFICALVTVLPTDQYTYTCKLNSLKSHYVLKP